MNEPGFLPLDQDAGDVLVGQAPLESRAHAEDAQHEAGRGVEEPNQRPGDLREGDQRPGEAKRECFGNLQGELLGHKLAEQKRQESDRDHDQRERNRLAVGRRLEKGRASRPICAPAWHR